MERNASRPRGSSIVLRETGLAAEEGRLREHAAGPAEGVMTRARPPMWEEYPTVPSPGCAQEQHLGKEIRDGSADPSPQVTPRTRGWLLELGHGV